jgi:hypothetical protein
MLRAGDDGGSMAQGAAATGRQATMWATLAAAVLLACAAVAWWVLRPGSTPGIAATAAAPAAADAAASDFIGIEGTRVRFASVQEAQALLATPDEWLMATGEVQRRTLMGSVAPVTLDAFARWQADNVRAWSPDEVERWRRALAELAPRLNALGLPLPPLLLLVRSSGRESAQTPHTRANAIVLPEHADLQGFSDADLLAHEVFHVLSRAHPALATRLYALLGFEPVGELRWPPAWGALRIADPDAPHLRHAMKLRVGSVQRWVMPVVVAARERADFAKGETIEHLMDTRLLVVEPGAPNEATLGVLQHGQPVWHTLQQVPEYLQRLGGNTDYVLHPEETIADNFMLLLSRRPVPNPALLQRIEQVLKDTRRAAPPAATGSGASSAPG